jgi:Tfp pilus assembly protein PilN
VILCVVIELGMIGTSQLLDARQERLAERSPEIEKIESAQNLANRLETLAAQQLRPFEMLAAINAPRPQSVEFLRVSTRGPLQLEIDAQTTNPNDLRTYEAALKALGFIETVAIQDPRSRSGRTTFSLEVRFKPRWTQPGGGL